MVEYRYTEKHANKINRARGHVPRVHFYAHSDTYTLRRSRPGVYTRTRIKTPYTATRGATGLLYIIL